MEIQIIRNEGEVFREYPYSSRPVEGNTSVPDRRKEDVRYHGGIARDTTFGNKPALLPKGSSRPTERKAIGPVRSALAKKDNDVVFLDNEIGLKDAFSDEGPLFSLNISTETVKDQYVIGKVNLDAANQKIGKYKEAQGYRLLPEPSLEIYV